MGKLVEQKECPRLSLQAGTAKEKSDIASFCAAEEQR
jgi:hypothetical protein